MRNDSSPLTARCRWMGAAFIALALTSVAAMAQAQTAAPQAQTDKANPPKSPERPDATPGPAPVEGVTVDAARRPRDANIPADKAAEYDAAAAKDEAFRKYRDSTPPLSADSKGLGDPNDQSKDFPGLQSYIPK